MIKMSHFDTDLLTAKDSVNKVAGDKKNKYTIIPLLYDNSQFLVMTRGTFKSYSNYGKSSRISYSIRMDVDQSDEEFFSSLELRIKSLVGPHKFSLVKTNERGDRSVSLKVYPNSAGAMGCKFSRKCSW